MPDQEKYTNRDRDQRTFYLVLNASGYLSTLMFAILFWWMGAHPYLHYIAFLFFVVYVLLGFAARFVSDMLILFRLSIVLSLVAFSLQIMWTGGVFSPSLPQLMIIPVLGLFYKPKSDRFLFFFLTIFAACLITFFTTHDLYVIDGIPDSYKGLYAVIAFSYVTVIIFTFILLFRNAVTSKNRQLGISLKELKLTTQKLIESEKMASIGQMMAGIAHELNNPINYIRGSSMEMIRCVEDITKLKELREEYLARLDEIKDPVAFHQAYLKFREEEEELKERISFDELWVTLQELMETIKFGTSKTSEIITSLGIYSRTKSDKDDVIEINRAIETSSRLVKHLLPTSESLQLKLGDNIPLVRGNEGRVSQVILNLMTNAIHVISEDGKVVVSSGFVQDEKLVVITVEDTGPGIPEDIQSKVFDPFFTTKEVGKGTGLGLSISRSIIEELGGTMSFSSDEKGTIFQLSLPSEFAE